jgi:hypothetical protein
VSVTAGTVYLDVKTNTATISKSGGLFSKLGGSLGGIFAGAFAAAGLIELGKALVSTAIDWTKAAEAAAAQNKVSFGIIHDAIGATVTDFAELTDWTTKFGTAIAADDEDLTTLASRYIRFMGLSIPQAERLVKLTYDLAAATGKSETTMAKLMLTIENAPAKAIPMLLKMGVLTKQQAKNAADLVAHHHEDQATLLLVAAAQDKVGGAAKDSATASERFTVVWENFKEWVGEKMLPAFEKVMTFAKNLVQEFQRATETGRWDNFKNYLKQVFDYLAAYIVYAFELAFAKAAAALVNAIISNPVLRTLLGPLGTNIGSARVGTPHIAPPDPTIPHLNTTNPTAPPGSDIGHFAKGGVVMRPMLAVVGESGPEAIVPLGRGRGMAGEIRITNGREFVIQLQNELDWNGWGGR